VDEAKRRVVEAVSQASAEEVPLERALGRVLAHARLADRDFPPTDRSAMDGYALRSGDCRSPGRRLEVVGELRAGRTVGDHAIGPGQALRIMTGAIVPPGADAVVPVERTHLAEDGRQVVVEIAIAPGEHVRARGGELQAGRAVVEPGATIRAAEIAALASIGATRLTVHRRPSVRVLSTGDEVVEPDTVPLAHQIRNSNAPLLLALLGELGIEGEYLGIAPDDRGELARSVERGLAADVLLITGGVSAGEYDLVAETLEAAGVRTLFHGVAMKPGKPILAGLRERSLVLALPGNPLSACVGFHVFAAPALRRAMGLARWDEAPPEVRLDEALDAAGGRRTYHVARVERAGGGLCGRALRAAGSGDVLALARGNAWLVTPEEGGRFAPGDAVPALLWSGFDAR
jgi:molybdopterin molybdotransferase